MKKWAFILFLIPLVLPAQVRRWSCGILIQQDTIRFELHQAADGSFSVLNGKERVNMEKKGEYADSVEYALSVFDASLIFPSNPKEKFSGWYRKGDAKTPSAGLRFEAGISPLRKAASVNYQALAGKWALEFLDGEKVQEKGILLLRQNGNLLEGSILTETGDYRFLNGEIHNNSAFLQTFDGGHAWYFRMEFLPDGKSLKGNFLYSQTGKQPFRGIRNDAAELASGFRNGSATQKIGFHAQDASGKIYSEADFTGKPLVLQVMGSWCPNCLDETRFLVEEYASRPAGTEFLALAFERKDEAYAFERIATVRRKLSVPYPVLYGGKANKDSASRALPAAGGISAFPTTIFVKSNGEILRVHSGFNGPATGEAYETWRKEFRDLLKEIQD